MKFRSHLIIVSNMEASKEFYYKVFGLKVINDFGANVVLEESISL